ncbi:MAG TPA: oligosaccharide flippase family protein [Terriglobales bacterium]|nr:oligosaccharide flippase family protein [Acidobacteriaceae bacterium]HKR28987.1 oligosaccharide flippase family protein [Terriglobales bacterium]
MLTLRRIWERLESRPRMRAILHGGASGLLSKGLALVVSMVTLPLLVRYLGRAEYGIWITISTSVVMFAVLDIGISSTLINFIAKAAANNDTAAARGYYSTAFWITVLISTLLAIIAFIVWPWVHWQSLFGLSDRVIALQASRCAMASVAFLLLNLPLSLANRVLAGFQEVHVANYFAMINSVLGLIAIVGGVAAHLSIVGLMICFSSAMLTGTLLLNGWLSFRSRPWIRPRISTVRWSLASDLFGEGLMFFVLQISGLVVFNSDNLVIAHYCGPGEVTPYSVTWRMLGYASMFHGLLIPALWPALSDAYHRRELAWVRSTYRRFWRLTMAGVTAAALILALLGQWIIRIWASQAAVPTQTLLWFMALWAVVYSLTTNQACLLAATQRLQLQAVIGVVSVIINLALSIYLVQRIGSLGAIIGTLTSYIVFVIAPQTWEVRNILRGRYLRAADAAIC